MAGQLQNWYKPGESAPVSGVYRIRHAAHRPPHECTLTQGQEFPPCRQCGDQVRFQLVLGLAADNTAPLLLVVESQASEAERLGRALDDKGYNVATVSSGLEAMDLLKHGEFDGVISDLELERKSMGLRLAGAAKALRSQPLVILAADRPGKEELRAAMRLRINYFVFKPVNVGELTRALERMMARRAQALDVE